LEKRRAYWNQDPEEFQSITVPQELYILPDNLIVAVNIKNDSPWKLKYINDKYIITNWDIKAEVSFPLRPKFYDYKMNNDKLVCNYVTLYWGNSLWLFIKWSCHLIDIKKWCHYCSLYQNRKKINDFEMIINNSNVEEALIKCFEDNALNVKQIMVNGGNFFDYDYWFKYYLNIAKNILDLVKKHKKDLEVHLIVAPPSNLELLELAKWLNLKIAINTEVYNDELFKKYCPWKVIHYPKQHIFNALKRLVDILWKNKVYSILVWWLDSINDLKEAILTLSNMNIVPVINVFHNDPWTPLENKKPPSTDYIFKIWQYLQEIYLKNNFTPFYLDCWRNSLDTEAYKILFNK